MNVLNLTKQLIALPSYVGNGCTEKAVADYLVSYCQQYLPRMSLKKQFIDNTRYNIILTDGSITKLLLNGHLDTVQPRSGWKTDQLIPTITDGKMFGLGTADMKGNIAAMLSALYEIKDSKGVMVLLYVDEEYDFLGMKAFINEYQNKINPALIVSGDGTDLQIGNGCRGLIEIRCIAKGLSAHASRPELGINAITGVINAVNKLTTLLKSKYTDAVLGTTSCNLAFLQGGLDLRSKTTNATLIGQEGNNVADIAEFVLDIRSAHVSLNAGALTKVLKELLQEEKLILESSTIRHDLGAWVTKKEELKSILNVISRPSFAKIGDRGFIDTQLLWEAFPVPCFTYGAGDGTTIHKANEYVRIADLFKAKDTYKKIILALKGGGIL